MKQAKTIMMMTLFLGGIATAMGFRISKSRNIHPFYMVDTSLPVGSRFCTKPTTIFYTTNPADAISGSIGKIQSTYYTTIVALSVCPTTVIYAAD